MEELWLFCEYCELENPHNVLKSKTSSNKGFTFQGVVKCTECNSTSNKEIREEPPLKLKLQVSDDDNTLNDSIEIDKGVLLEVGETRPHPDGVIQITALEIFDKRPQKVFSDEMPIIWAKKVTNARVRFAVHDIDETHSFKQEFGSQEEFYVGLKLRLEGRLAIIKSIKLYGGKSVKSAYAIDIVRVTCRYIDERRK